MSKNGGWLAGALLATVLAAPASASDHYRMAGGGGDFYFGHISFTEAKSDGNDPTVLREGSVVPEPATLNTPIGPGDVIRTTDARRCEIQFDTGTIVRLDVSSELKVETILAGSLSTDTGMSNLVLGAGRAYVMFKQYDDHETFQVLTSNAAVKLRHNSVAVIAVSGDGPTEVRVKAGKASVLFGGEAAHTRTRTVKALGRLIVLADGRFEESGYPSDTSFETWNEGLNANFTELHKGLSPLPKPIRTLPLAVFDFAQRFGNANGEWLWDSLYGYVWRPFLNDQRYPWGNWSPYVYGRWSEVGNSMFWVPEEPWGWVPYHLGLWQWDRKLGWVWMPGSLFAPAWAAWDFFEGHFSWRPWTLFDWCFQGGTLYPSFAYGYDGLGGSWAYYYVRGGSTPPAVGTPPMTQISKNQLKKKDASSVSVPREMKKAYGNIVAALGRKDGRVLESLKGTLDRSVFVARGDLNEGRLHDKALTFDKVRDVAASPGAPGKTATPQPRAIPLVDALLAHRKNAVAGRIVAAPRPLVGPAPAGADRFRDWNPDIRVALRLGVRIDYSSRTNEVRCPELKISSRDVDRRNIRMSSGGIISGYGQGAFGASGTSGTTSSGQVSSRAGHDRSSSPSGSGAKADGGKTKSN